MPSDIVFTSDAVSITGDLHATSLFTNVIRHFEPGLNLEAPTIPRVLTFHVNQLDLQSLNDAPRHMAQWSPDDELILNAGGTFGGGVRVDSNLSVGSFSTPMITGTFLGRKELVLRCDCVSMSIPAPGAQGEHPRPLLARSDKDELVVNQNGSFAGGVVIDGEVNIPGDLTVNQGITVGGVVIGAPGPKPVAQLGVQTVLAPRTSLVITHDAIVLKTFQTVPGPSFGGIGKPLSAPATAEVDLDLIAELKKLRSEVDALNAKVK